MNTNSPAVQANPTMFTTLAQITAASDTELVAFYNRLTPGGKVKKFDSRKSAEARCYSALALALPNDDDPELTSVTLPGEPERPGFKIPPAPVVKLPNAPTLPKAPALLTPDEYRAKLARDAEEAEAKSHSDYSDKDGQEEQEDDKHVIDVMESSTRKHFWPIGPNTPTPPAASKPKASPSSATANSTGVSSSWKDPAVAAARTKRHGVSVNVGGKVDVHKSVLAAFTFYGLPVSKHIRFRGDVKKSGEETFKHNGHEYVFTLVDLGE